MHQYLHNYHLFCTYKDNYSLASCSLHAKRAQFAMTTSSLKFKLLVDKYLPRREGSHGA